MKLSLPFATVPILAGLILGSGGVAAQPVFPTPPPLPAEVLPRPPVSEAPLIWQPGDWVFAGGSYRYEAGRYVPAAGHGRQWMFGHWEASPAGLVWVPGHWI